VRRERKDLPDLVHSLTVERPVFINRLKKMSGYAHRLLVCHSRSEPSEVTISSQCRKPQPHFPVLDCAPGGAQRSFSMTENHPLGEEAVPSYLYQGSPVSLARKQRLRPIPGGRRTVRN
jgi:hypothetical protein